MKKILIFLSIALYMVSCQPDSIPGIGEPREYRPLLVGSWNLVKLTQIDADAESKSFPGFATSKDLTNVFPNHPYTDFSITFNGDGTFTTSLGNSYVNMLSSGNWALNDPDYPSAIVLSNEGVIQEIGLGSLSAIVLGKVEFKEEKKQPDTGKVKIRYIYSLEKAE